MKIKGNDGITRNFGICSKDLITDRYSEAYCFECGEKFGVHDTHILIPMFREHSCWKQVKPRLTTIVSTLGYLDGIPMFETAICPECGVVCQATYSAPGGRLRTDYTCTHFSDLCSTGGNGVGFMFWITRDEI